MISVSNSAPGNTLTPLIFARTDPATLTTLSFAPNVNGVGFIVFMPLWALRAIGVGIALILRFLTRAALAMPSARSPVSISLSVLMTLGAFGYVRLPVQSVVDGVAPILSGSSPIQIAQAVVLMVVITMTALQPLGPLASERHQYKDVSQELFGNPIAIQSAPAVLALIAADHDLLEDAPLGDHRSAPTTLTLPIQGSNPAFIRNCITGIAGDRQPSFITHNNNDNTSTRKGR